MYFLIFFTANNLDFTIQKIYNNIFTKITYQHLLQYLKKLII